MKEKIVSFERKENENGQLVEVYFIYNFIQMFAFGYIAKSSIIGSSIKDVYKAETVKSFTYFRLVGDTYNRIGTGCLGGETHVSLTKQLYRKGGLKSRI